MLAKIAKPVSWITLIVLIVPSILFLAGRLGLDQAKWIMLLATIGWFSHLAEGCEVTRPFLALSSLAS
ncbi:hypothetical protein ACFL6U_04385 [Planctomycetota bacterium]